MNVRKAIEIAAELRNDLDNYEMTKAKKEQRTALSKAKKLVVLLSVGMD